MIYIVAYILLLSLVRLARATTLESTGSGAKTSFTTAPPGVNIRGIS